MNEERDLALEKIRKLLRMKRGGTAAEVETALALAQQLAAKHGIDMASVNPDEDEQQRPIGHDDHILGARVQWECKYAMLIAQEFFNVSAFTVQTLHPFRRRIIQQITFVGTDWDRQIAGYVWDFLVGQMRREWKLRRGRCRHRQAFMYGMYIGICIKLREARLEPEGNGLMLVNRELQRREKYTAENFGRLSGSEIVPSGDAEEAKRRGYYAGRETEIRKGVTGQRDPARLLA
jgi:hypothetical protein